MVIVLLRMNFTAAVTVKREDNKWNIVTVLLGIDFIVVTKTQADKQTKIPFLKIQCPTRAIFVSHWWYAYC